MWGSKKVSKQDTQRLINETVNHSTTLHSSNNGASHTLCMETKRYATKSTRGLREWRVKHQSVGDKENSSAASQESHNCTPSLNQAEHIESIGHRSRYGRADVVEKGNQHDNQYAQTESSNTGRLSRRNLHDDARSSITREFACNQSTAPGRMVKKSISEMLTIRNAKPVSHTRTARHHCCGLRSADSGGQMENSRARRQDDICRPAHPVYNQSFVGGLQYPRCYANKDAKVTPEPLPQCPICVEDFDATDMCFKPCSCGFQMCLFCYNRVRLEFGHCPMCRRSYEPSGNP